MGTGREENFLRWKSLGSRRGGTELVVQPPGYLGEMPPTPVDALQEGGSNAPLTLVTDRVEFDPGRELGASRYRYTAPGPQHLDALLVNKGADVLVVTFHGALNRRATRLPRFERLASTMGHEVSALFFADPSLWLSKKLQLAWFTGGPDLDVPALVADWSVRAAAAVGASRLVFSGSSGGGFAALQVSALVPGSVALPFNPQTSIYGYVPDGHWSAQQRYLDAVWPHLAGTVVGPDGDWTASLDDRVSAVRRYSRPVSNSVLYVQNVNEPHYAGHCLPFVAAADEAGNHVRVHEYHGSSKHGPPDRETFDEHLAQALRWARKPGESIQ